MRTKQWLPTVNTILCHTGVVFFREKYMTDNRKCCTLAFLKSLSVCDTLEIALFHTFLPFNTLQFEVREDEQGAAVQSKSSRLIRLR